VGEKPVPQGTEKRNGLCMEKQPSEEVLVMDSEKRFLEYTRPALARKYLREGKAKIFSKTPFAIQLFHSKSVSSIRRKTMAVKNFTDYFKVERDVYVQNISNAQLSLEFNMGEGRVEGFTVPPSRDPINLTQHIPFMAIKNSMDFRKMLSRRPPVITVLSQEEYEAYFSKRAKDRNMVSSDGTPDIDAAIDASEERRRRTSDKSLRETITDKEPEPIHDVIEKGTGPGGAAHFGERQRVSPSKMVSEDEIINPRVLHLCNQVKAEVEEHERMSASDLLEALQNIPSLTIDDYEHVRAHGFYKSIKKWAKMETARIIQDQEQSDDNDVAEAATA
jgi:hypothetical protein